MCSYPGPERPSRSGCSGSLPLAIASALRRRKTNYTLSVRQHTCLLLTHIISYRNVLLTTELLVFQLNYYQLIMQLGPRRGMSAGHRRSSFEDLVFDLLLLMFGTLLCSTPLSRVSCLTLVVYVSFEYYCYGYHIFIYARVV